jgi:hypothetical protein
MSMREQLRSKLESQGIKFDDINLIDDFDSFNFNFDDEQDESRYFWEEKIMPIK